MKKIYHIFWAATLLCACNETAIYNTTCNTKDDCMGSNQICINNTCIEKCKEDFCQSNQICAESGICVDLKTDDEPECSAQKPCTEPGKVCSVDYVCVTAECSIFVPCKDSSKKCNPLGVCVSETVETEDCRKNASLCTTNQFCNDNGFCEYNKVVDADCSKTVPCKEDYAVCNDAGKCVSKCLKGTCGAGLACAEDGLCFVSECSSIDACGHGLFCQNNKCVTRDALVCYDDSECGEGYGCDKNKCVPYDSCSLERTCADGKVCHEGKCIDKIKTACTKTADCASGLTCVAGACVACNCSANESCNPDGTCSEKDYSVTKNIRVGDACTHSPEFAFCEGNRKFNCTSSSDSGYKDFYVGVEDCSARACGTTSDEGIGCHEACPSSHVGDFYGACISYYGGQSCFTHTCEMMPEGGTAWTLTNGYKDCLVNYNNGRCSYEPDEIHKHINCTTDSYPDVCKGNWLLYCYSTSSSPIYGGMVSGTSCALSGADAFCALPSERALADNPDLIGDCVRPCSVPGESISLCMVDEDGEDYSYDYYCALSQDGRLGYFTMAKLPCNAGCNVKTGLCN